jgi:type I restriction enzyme R subunit
MDAGMLYESPYTDMHPRGVDGVFDAAEANRLVAVIDGIRCHATA